MNIEWKRGTERNVLMVRPVDIDGGVIVLMDTGLTGISFVVPGEQAKEFAQAITVALARESA